MTQEEKPTIANAVKKFTSKERTEQAIRELIEYHVTEALESASKKASVYADEGGYSEFVDEESILNAYPLTNIE